MIILHDFNIDIFEYESRGKENEFPIFERCLSCDCLASGNLHRHGYYWRYGIEGDEQLRIPICRYKCISCKVTISVLPSFLIPYFQYTLYMIFEGIRRLLSGEKSDVSRQILAYHLKRFYEKLHWIHSFFADHGSPSGVSKDRKKEAQKYVTMIRDIGVSSFFRRSWGHLSSYFMGKLILPYLSSEKNKIIPT